MSDGEWETETDRKLELLAADISAVSARVGHLTDLAEETLRLIRALGGRQEAPQAATSKQAAPTPGAVFPNYGKSKNAPIHGADPGDLDYYAAGCRRTLDDPSKARWHDKERALLVAIEAERGRQGSAPASQPAPGSDDDLPF